MAELSQTRLQARHGVDVDDGVAGAGQGRSGTFRFFSTITMFGMPRDVTVDNLHIECCFPADRETEEVCGKLRMYQPYLLQSQGGTSEGNSTSSAMYGASGGIRHADSVLRRHM